MEKIKGFRFWGRSPLTIIELIIGISSIVAGIYIASPLLTYSTQINGAGALVALLGHPYVLIAYGGLFLLSGLVVIYGVLKRNYVIRSRGLFMNICVRTYALLATFLTQGLLPLTWLSSLVLILVTIICYVTVRGFIHRGAEE